MTSPDPDYSPNPDRAIFVQGAIDQEMVFRLTPQIVSLLKTREPITVYIDSRGGRTDYKESICNALIAPNQAGDPPCKFITVAMTVAASAAADLLSSGFYSLAHRETVIMYHGVRDAGADGPLTAEETYSLLQRLRAGNESYATRLARDTEENFIFRFISHHHQLDEVRKNNPSAKPLSDLECFLLFLSDRVSNSATKLLRLAFERYLTYSALLDSATKKWKKGAAKKTFVQMEVDQIKAIMEFEIKRNKKNKDWNFEKEGIHRVTDDFFLLNEYLAFLMGGRLRDICTSWGMFLITPKEANEIDKLPAGEKDKKLVEIASPTLRPIWSYFMALCHVLQQSDHYLSALDAFWLGLIDEVIGIPDLPSLRVFYEKAEELEEKQVVSDETKQTSEQAQLASGTEAAAGAEA